MNDPGFTELLSAGFQKYSGISLAPSCADFVAPQLNSASVGFTLLTTFPLLLWNSYFWWVWNTRFGKFAFSATSYSLPGRVAAFVAAEPARRGNSVACKMRLCVSCHRRRVCRRASFGSFTCCVQLRPVMYLSNICFITVHHLDTVNLPYFTWRLAERLWFCSVATPAAISLLSSCWCSNSAPGDCWQKCSPIRENPEENSKGGVWKSWPRKKR